MRCETTFKTERLKDNDEGEWWEPYTVTVRADLVEGPDEYNIREGTVAEVEAVDAEGDVEVWLWSRLEGSDSDAAWAGLIADYQAKAAPLKRCPHCRNVLEVTP